MKNYTVKEGFAILDNDRDVVCFYPLDEEKAADEFLYLEKVEWNNKYLKEQGYVVFEDRYSPILCFSSEEEANSYVDKMQKPHDREKEAIETQRRKEKSNERLWQKIRVDNIERYGTEHPSKLQRKIEKEKEKDRMSARTDYEWYGERYTGASAILNYREYLKKLRKAESWYFTNPRNDIRLAEVNSLRLRVEEFEKEIRIYSRKPEDALKYAEVEDYDDFKKLVYGIWNKNTLEYDDSEETMKKIREDWENKNKMAAEAKREQAEKDAQNSKDPKQRINKIMGFVLLGIFIVWAISGIILLQY